MVNSNEKPARVLQPLPVPELKWQWLTVDFIRNLPETKAGHTAIGVCGPAEQVALCWNDMDAEELAQIIVRLIFRPHQTPLNSLYPATLSPLPNAHCGILPFNTCLKKDSIVQGISHTAVLAFIL